MLESIVRWSIRTHPLRDHLDFSVHRSDHLDSSAWSHHVGSVPCSGSLMISFAALTTVIHLIVERELSYSLFSVDTQYQFD